jgi:hypothetical protein
MHLCSIPLAYLALLAGDDGRDKKENELVEEVRNRVCAVLSKLDPAPKDKAAAEQALRQELSRIVIEHAAKLRPANGSKKYVSSDKVFLLVLGANGVNGGNGTNVEAEDKQAKLIVAIAGNGSDSQGNGKVGGGGSASALTPSGIAVALGGSGGAGVGKDGGGGGGGAGSEGGVGSISLGGEGGKAVAGGGGDGGPGGGSGIKGVISIVEAVQKLGK